MDGELLDGRRGLVPSNYVERLVGDDLLTFHQQVVLGIKDSDDCVSTSLLDFNYNREVGDESQRLIIGMLFNQRKPIAKLHERNYNDFLYCGIRT